MAERYKPLHPLKTELKEGVRPETKARQTKAKAGQEKLKSLCKSKGIDYDEFMEEWIMQNLEIPKGNGKMKSAISKNSWMRNKLWLN